MRATSEDKSHHKLLKGSGKVSPKFFLSGSERFFSGRPRVTERPCVSSCALAPRHGIHLAPELWNPEAGGKGWQRHGQGGKGALTALAALCLTNLDESDIRKFEVIWSVLPTQLVCILVLASKCLAAVGGEKECDVHVQYLLA